MYDELVLMIEINKHVDVLDVGLINGNENEKQVEIRCRGQELEPVLTLQHVRDAIWRSGSRSDSSSLSQNITLLPNSSTSDHLMVLHYGRTVS
ncbi:hypothetical protein CARUB_v10002757mg [Capsella rubella]|uniref:Uncharacterized protein n=1 Tax=Capsella rubella TaxID=81985 RepID=R0FJB4_9BRAS|nr:hypothetical protein CARUB_v10002757mg [Capsella rubella]